MCLCSSTKHSSKPVHPTACVSITLEPEMKHRNNEWCKLRDKKQTKYKNSPAGFKRLQVPDDDKMSLLVISIYANHVDTTEKKTRTRSMCSKRLWIVRRENNVSFTIKALAFRHSHQFEAISCDLHLKTLSLPGFHYIHKSAYSLVRGE